MTLNSRNLVEMLETTCSVHAGRPALGTRTEAGWKWTTYAELLELVTRFREGLASLGVTAGDRVAIISHNRLEWAVAAYATYALGATFVPLYEEQKPDEWKFILKDSGAKVVVLGSPGVAERLSAAGPLSAPVEHRVTVGGSDEVAFERLLERGKGSQGAFVHPAPDTHASLIYTSGTTGTPKGVALSHGNILANLTAVHQLFDFSEKDRSLAFIPWAHAFGHTCELHTMVSLGASMGINDALPNLPRNLLEIQPTVLVAVPKIFNRIFTGIHAEIAKKPAFVQRLFQAGVSGAKHLQDGGSSAGDRIAHFLADLLIFSKVRKRFGGKLSYVVSGGAALATEVAELIQAMGMTVYEGYGLTETSPLVSANHPGHIRLGTVGRVVPGVEVRVQRDPAATDQEGELVVYGPNVMKGYHNRPEEQAKAFTDDGGFRTGDLGYLDEDGYLHITGRIKEQYKLTNGKYVAPVQLEEELKLSPYITNAMISGANRPYNVAVVVLDAGAIQRWASEKGLTIASPAADDRVRELIAAEIAAHSAGFKDYERIGAFLMTTEDFTVENELLTPTLKLRRRGVVARYGTALEALYREAPRTAA